MNRNFVTLSLVLAALLLSVLPVAAQQAGFSLLEGNAAGAGFGTALVLIGAGWGFGRIGQAALESMARQPEIAPRIQTGMLIIAALLEGATFFALIVCIIMAVKA
ncbi:MAG: ATP synthase F0 subunit C [Gemmatales bacterium]|nr:ATP synthase F0 subunit C [Gemmatales bacterium]MCS7161598.1 ATP synthase F0 subunit C [Gemmatales bacterium]MDW8176801.1 ATP synthase F0 subunit C [Gemmatales bacterium]MDW8221778.1 ATP synthase F0 subunit C [Gemmatales bacterium]